MKRFSCEQGCEKETRKSGQASAGQTKAVDRRGRRASLSAFASLCLESTRCLCVLPVPHRRSDSEANLSERARATRAAIKSQIGQSNLSDADPQGGVLALQARAQAGGGRCRLLCRRGPAAGGGGLLPGCRREGIRRRTPSRRLQSNGGQLRLHCGQMVVKWWSNGARLLVN